MLDTRLNGKGAWRRLSGGIAAKLYCLAFLSLLAVAALATSSIYFSKTTEDAAKILYGDGFIGVTNATRLELLLEQHRRIVESFPAEVNRETIQAESTELEQIKTRLLELMPDILAKKDESSFDTLEQRISDSLPALFEEAKQVAFFAHEFAQDKAVESVDRYIRIASRTQLAVRSYRQLRVLDAQEAISVVSKTAKSLMLWVLMCVAVACILIGPIGLATMHNVLSRLRRITEAMAKLAGNDTTTIVPSREDRDEVGEMARAVQVFKDNAIQLIEREGELKTLNHRIDVALNNMTHGLCMFDAQQKLIVCNKTYIEMYDLPPALTEPGTLLQAIDDHRASVGNSAIANPEQIAAATPARTELEAWAFAQNLVDGRIIAVSQRPMPDGGWVAVHEDITERRRAEAKIAHLARHDMLTNLPNRVLFREHLEMAFGGAQPGRGCAVSVAKGKLDTRIPELTPDELGDMSGALAVFRDNALEIRIAKDQAEEARLLAEAASRTKSAFLANMSHELRTPLNAIIGYSEILHEDAADRKDTASQADLVKIQSAGKHLLGLINDILDLSKIESGRMDVHLEDVDLGKLVSEVRVLVAPLIGQNANRLEVEMPDDIGAMRVDMVKLKQSLINLLSNAAKFTKRGIVKLAVGRAASGSQASLVTFAVSDSGIGMSDDQMSRLFQAFTQADATTTRNYGGTGLGLTITKHFCTMLGGSIDVTSKAGEGSTFTITLPDSGARGHPAVPAAEAPRISGSVTGKTVLVVDDDPAVHDVLRMTLVKEGYRLLHAYDGAEALKVARDDPPDVITLDVMMPQLDGWTVLGKLKSDPDLAHIPVIMLTVVDERTMGYSLGAAEYMTKPVDRARLVELLRRFAAKSQEAVILVVDDDADVRAIVKSTVEKAGLKAAEAGNGQAALDWLSTNSPPALILLDLMMPVMDGFEFLEKVKEIASVRRVPIVVLTAKDLTESERSIINERTMLVLTKGAQPLSSLGSALSVMARQPLEAAHQKVSEKEAR